LSAPNRLKAWFHRVVLARRWLTFIVMGLAFLAFGIGTLNLIHVVQANLELLVEHGWQAVMDGGGRQLVELLVTGYLSMAGYLVFKTCEHSLVHALGEAPAPATVPLSPPEPKETHEDRPAAG
jgi:hypothetical protein